MAINKERGRWDLRATPTIWQNLLGKSCVLPTCKKTWQVKKESISNSLA
jgi:hypothetical protein